jgi:hypothetical protein
MRASVRDSCNFRMLARMFSGSAVPTPSQRTFTRLANAAVALRERFQGHGPARLFMSAFGGVFAPQLLLAEGEGERAVASVLDRELEQRRDVVLVLEVVETTRRLGMASGSRPDSVEELAEVILDVDDGDVVAAGADGVGEQLDLLGDGVPRLDDARGVPIGGASAVTTPVLDDVVLRLVPQNQDACALHATATSSTRTIIV